MPLSATAKATKVAPIARTGNAEVVADHRGGHRRGVDIHARVPRNPQLTVRAKSTTAAEAVGED
jgi:hypothetical protein